MRVLFLDIDGVLVTDIPGWFRQPLLQNLWTVVQATGAKVVLSSDWRRSLQARVYSRAVLTFYGAGYIACTPCLPHFPLQRPHEILRWKEEYEGQPGNEPLVNWVAVDDRDLLQENRGLLLAGHFVRTNPAEGLTEEKAQECIRILTEKPEVPAEVSAGVPSESVGQSHI
mmetsp:Transcript_161001/g.283744  ORF Transcript_161001/g.283744 Transcript_161001/m.283744 type:complete len:170 (-) Transcript_161001:23-532(-)